MWWGRTGELGDRCDGRIHVVEWTGVVRGCVVEGTGDMHRFGGGRQVRWTGGVEDRYDEEKTGEVEDIIAIIMSLLFPYIFKILL